MGVIPCSREDCRNIMCDTYVNGIGYICTDCQDEFKRYVFKEGISTDTETEIYTALREFMDYEKASFVNYFEHGINYFFEKYTNV